MLGENSGVHQFVLGIFPRAAIVFVNQFLVGICSLRVFVQHFHVAVRRRRIQIEIAFLDVFAMIALIAGESKHPLLEDGVMAIPQRQSEANVLVAVAESGNAVLSPAIGARACVIVRKELPSRPVGAVVLAHGSPLPLGKIRSPALPVVLARARSFETSVFNGLQSRHGGWTSDKSLQRIVELFLPCGGGGVKKGAYPGTRTRGTATTLP